MFFLPANFAISRNTPAFSRPFVQAQARQLDRQLDGSLDDSLERFFGADNSPPRSPALDVAESDSAYTATLEMPGVAKENIQVSVEGRVVTVKALEAATEPAQTSDTTASATATETAAAPAGRVVDRAVDRLVYRERSATRYARRFSLPVELEQGATVAKLDHGVLTLTLPKRAPRNAANVTVN